MTTHISRRSALRRLAAGAAAVPFFIRTRAGAAPIETLHHAAFGANGMGLSDIRSLTAHSRRMIRYWETPVLVA